MVWGDSQPAASDPPLNLKIELQERNRECYPGWLDLALKDSWMESLIQDPFQNISRLTSGSRNLVTEYNSSLWIFPYHISCLTRLKLYLSLLGSYFMLKWQICWLLWISCILLPFTAIKLFKIFFYNLIWILSYFLTMMQIFII